MAISFEDDISPMFSARDIQCMKRYFVLLDDYTFMSDPTGDSNFTDHASARTVYARLVGTFTPQMPLGGPFWSQSQLDLFQSWMTDDFQP